MLPTESVAGMVSAPVPGAGVRASAAGIHALPPPLDPALLTELWRASNAASWGLTSIDCAHILFDAATASNFGLPENQSPTPQQQAAYFRALCLPDLALARACARGHESAWQHFVAVYRQPLIRAATAITGSDSLGRDLADQLYAELYGLTSRDGERRCPLASYRIAKNRSTRSTPSTRPPPIPRRSRNLPSFRFSPAPSRPLSSNRTAKFASSSPPITLTARRCPSSRAPSAFTRPRSAERSSARPSTFASRF
jgi:hypothetical protein